MQDVENNILTKEDYIKILESRFGTKHIELINKNISPLSEEVEGFLGEHYILKLTYKVKDEKPEIETFFIKTKPTKTTLQQDLVIGLMAYDKEVYLYDKIFPTFRKLGFNIDIVPKGYYCKDNETIVMEYINNKGYESFPKDHFYDMNHCKISLRSVATFHANFIAYEEMRSKELGRPFRIKEERPELYKEFFYIPNDKDGPGIKYIKTFTDFYLKIADNLPVSQTWKATFENKLRNVDIGKIFCMPLPYRQTVTHGDLWSNNMSFKYENGVPNHCCLYDFQILRHHHISFDALIILYANTRRAFRKKHLDELLNYHYDCFEESLKGYGYEAKNILPREDYMMSAKVLALVALFQAGGGRTIVRLPMEVAKKAIDDGENIDDLMFSEKRVKLVVDYFKENEYFRTIVTDDVYDMYEHLLESEKLHI